MWKAAVYSLLLGTALCLVYVNTKINPADHPSRFQPIPPPSSMPAWVADLTTSQGGASPLAHSTPCGQEVFAGRAGLTVAMGAEGQPMKPPIDTSYVPSSTVFSSALDIDISSGAIDWTWLPPPMRHVLDVAEHEAGMAAAVTFKHLRRHFGSAGCAGKRVLNQDSRPSSGDSL